MPRQVTCHATFQSHVQGEAASTRMWKLKQIFNLARKMYNFYTSSGRVLKVLGTMAHSTIPFAMNILTEKPQLAVDYAG